MSKLTYALVMAGLVSGSAFAADPAPAAPTLSQVLGASGITATGYVDASYSNFNTDGGQLRQFDTRHNSFVMNQAALTVSYLPASGAGAMVNLIAGSDAKILRNSELFSEGGTGSQFDVFQAYGQYAIGSLALQAGKFATLAGAETVNVTTNSNISRSLLFTNLEPLSHTGVRAVYTVNDALTLTGGVNNGWNYTSAPSGIDSKTIELGASGTAGKMFSYAAAFYTGQAPTGSPSGEGRLSLVDLVGTFNATDALSFVLNLDYKKQNDLTGTTDATAKGGALYVNYALNDEWSLTARGEYIKDSDGLITGLSDNTLNEGTIGVNYSPMKNATLRAELRRDHSKMAYFTDGSDVKKNQSSVGLEAIYKF
jgi:hypothetical protein